MCTPYKNSIVKEYLPEDLNEKSFRMNMINPAIDQGKESV